MFVRPGARALLLEAERERFLTEQWPRIHATIQRLGITPDELLEAAGQPASPAADQER
jgi:GntR family transcriptional regulator